jgi:hypothetical protein
MAETLKILEDSNFIIRYSVDNKEYGYIPTFLKHQRISGEEGKQSAKYPLPPNDAGQTQERRRSDAGQTQEGSTNVEGSCPGKGKGKGKGKGEFNAKKNTEPPEEPPENQTLSTADAVVLDSPDLPPEKPDVPPENLPVSQNKPPAFSPVDSPPKKQNKLELTPEQSELYRATKACFEVSDRAKAIMYQDDQSAKMQMRKLKEIIIRCSHIAPGITVDFLQSVLEHFKVMTNSAKYQGSWVFTPRCLSTHWIWEIVISSLPERETELDRTIQARIKGLFRGG